MGCPHHIFAFGPIPDSDSNLLANRFALSARTIAKYMRRQFLLIFYGYFLEGGISPFPENVKGAEGMAASQMKELRKKSGILPEPDSVRSPALGCGAEGLRQQLGMMEKSLNFTGGLRITPL